MKKMYSIQISDVSDWFEEKKKKLHNQIDVLMHISEIGFPLATMYLGSQCNPTFFF